MLETLVCPLPVLLTAAALTCGKSTPAFVNLVSEQTLISYFSIKNVFFFKFVGFTGEQYLVFSPHRK